MNLFPSFLKQNKEPVIVQGAPKNVQINDNFVNEK